MDTKFYIGSIAAILTTAAFLPQVIKTHQTRHTKDLSMLMYIMFSIGLVMWLVYGFMLGELPIIGANGITLVMSLYVLFMMIRFK